MRRIDFADEFRRLRDNNQHVRSSSSEAPFRERMQKWASRRHFLRTR
jgi:hypothetical protein